MNEKLKSHWSVRRHCLSSRQGVGITSSMMVGLAKMLSFIVWSGDGQLKAIIISPWLVEMIMTIYNKMLLLDVQLYATSQPKCYSLNITL